MSEHDEKYRDYLRDLGELLKGYAFNAKRERADKTEPPDREFYDGMLLGYHRVISLMQQQAIVFGIDLEDLNLKDINPDRDLV